MQGQPEALLAGDPLGALDGQQGQADPVIVVPDDDAPVPAEAPAEDPEAVAELGRVSFEESIKSACTIAVLELFPDICPVYVQETCESLAYDYESVVSHILDKLDDGPSYPRRADLKRKRVTSSVDATANGVTAATNAFTIDYIDDSSLSVKEREERAARFFNSDERRSRHMVGAYTPTARTLLQQAYPYVPHKFITTQLTKHGDCLLLALLDLDEHIVHKGPLHLGFVFKKTKTKLNPVYSMESLPGMIRIEESESKKDALEEYLAALKIRQLRKVKRDEERQRELSEAANIEQAKKDGTIKDCECCFGDFPMNRMVHCNASTIHWFCVDCARRMAETQIGLSKYELACMSMDGCKAGFSRAERDRFLDPKTAMALDSIEQEFVLRVAGIENLETCPFCPYAAEYPPVEVNKEFACQNSECEAVTCRLCRKESHIPKSCDEVEKDKGAAVRLTIEEAMSLAMIRKCNKCGTPFIKELGCNKMTCTRAGCSNVQCYVCHQSCDYSHFDDTSRGGKAGNCPLFESAEERHEVEVLNAEEAARQKAIENNPDVHIDHLKFQVSEQVAADESRRKNEDAERRAANQR
ncbi:ring finger protein [Sporothrix brasiliensis 5110]|uniref:Ring finger protein n=1 Tax=Sporothrix brasiliensis 5110 TaxID=1398154 RepID=A0A0C2ER60_9PEZI|nr:ring finger protein [Sporothrix brasiliensis 5110]KIH88844.1 ring finger protein [Sporothrix brasiliensis 5110]